MKDKINSSPYSQIKIFLHTQKMNEMKKGELTPPIYIRIKPTNFCNHKCNYCHYSSGQYLDLVGQEKENQISWVKMEQIINDISTMSVKAVTFSGGGEPLLYPHITESMRMILDNNIDLSIITNGHLLSGERAELLTNAKWVRISIESATAEMYSRIRGVSKESFDIVCKNISEFSKIKKSNCELGINFVIAQENSDQVLEAAKLFKDLGVNHIKFSGRYSNEFSKYHSPIKEKVFKQLEEAQRLATDNFRIINLYNDDFLYANNFVRRFDVCYTCQLVTVIAADSKVYLCHDKAYLEGGILGDLNQMSFKDLWNSDEVRNKILGYNARQNCNHHCTYDTRNELLNQFFSLDQNHINFI